jgi:nucleoside-diphosphate-sugar epimerase
MFLVMGITGKVGGATARHLLARGKRVRALVRSREKAADWMDQGVELVDGDWNDTAAIERAVDGVDGAFVMLPAVWAPSPDFKEAKGVIANYVEVLTKAAPPRVVALSSMGANRTSGLGIDHRPVAAGARLSRLGVAGRCRARRRVLRELPLRPARRPGRHAPSSLQSDQPEIDDGRDERHRRRGRDAADRAGVVGASRHRTWFDGQRG